MPMPPQLAAAAERRMQRKNNQNSKHPGFDKVAQSIASRENIPLEKAKAILAAKSRGASAAAKKANPRLKRVSG